MAYSDFILAFEPTSEPERYRIVAHSPAEGQVSAPFVSPFGEARVNTWRNGLDPDEMHMIGSLLFRRVFSTDILRAFQDARRFAQRQGLAMRLKMILDESLAPLPWEFMFEPETHQFLALEQRTAIVRYFDFPFSLAGLNPWEKMGLFVLAADGCAAMDSDPMLGLVFRTGAQVELLNVAQVEGSVKTNEAHRILHIQANAGRDPSTGAYALDLSDCNGPKWLTSDRLIQWLRTHSTVRLVVLDAGASKGARDASGLAAELVARRVVSAAVAFQYPMPVVMRSAFLNAFYRALSRNDGVDLALVEGRQAILAADGEWQWGSPVLYSALRDDQPRQVQENLKAEVALEHRSILAK